MRTLMSLCDPCQWFYYHWSTASALVVVVSNLHPERASGTSMAGEKSRRSAMDIKRLAGLLQRGAGRLLVIDSRTFSEYNASHVHGAVNVCCSKLVKRRLQQDKVSVTELLQPNGKVKVSSVCLRECVGSFVIEKLGKYEWHPKVVDVCTRTAVSLWKVQLTMLLVLSGLHNHVASQYYNELMFTCEHPLKSPCFWRQLATSAVKFICTYSIWHFLM